MSVSLSTFAADPATTNVVDRAVGLAREAAEAGLHTVWFGQTASYDAVTLAATGGRFRLGLGLGAKAMLEPAYGLPYPPPIPHLREYLLALRPLLAGDDAVFEGEVVTSRPPTPTAVAGATPPVEVVVAAMGPRALAVTGELADGTLPFLAGPRVLARDIVPAVTAAAAAAGREAPRVVVAVPAVVTDRPEQVRATAAASMGFYDRIPSYRRVLDAEGVGSAADLLLVGDEDVLAAGVRRYVDAGATEVTLTQTDIGGEDDRRRTWAGAGALVRG